MNTTAERISYLGHRYRAAETVSNNVKTPPILRCRALADTVNVGCEIKEALHDATEADRAHARAILEPLVGAEDAIRLTREYTEEDIFRGLA